MGLSIELAVRELPRPRQPRFGLEVRWAVLVTSPVNLRRNGEIIEAGAPQTCNRHTPERLSVKSTPLRVCLLPNNRFQPRSPTWQGVPLQRSNATVLGQRRGGEGHEPPRCNQFRFQARGDTATPLHFSLPVALPVRRLPSPGPRRGAGGARARLGELSVFCGTSIELSIERPKRIDLVHGVVHGSL